MMNLLSRRDLMRYGAAVAVTTCGGMSPAKADELLKIGIVLDSSVAEVGWTKQHSLAAAAVRQAIGDRVAIDIVDNVFQPQDAERVFRSFATSGHQLIYGTSFSHSLAAARVAPQFPGVAFQNCGGIKILDNLGALDAKNFESSSIAGIAAGKMTKTGKLGFISGFPIPDIVGPGNAMLLGAQSTRPEATCNVIFLFLSHGVFHEIGVISYSIYLIQCPYF